MKINLYLISYWCVKDRREGGGGGGRERVRWRRGINMTRRQDKKGRGTGMNMF